MLKHDKKVAIFLEGALNDYTGKMGHGVLRYSPNPIACVVDSTHAGKNVQDVIPCPRPCPVVATVEEALALHAQVLLLGCATPGGYIPETWYPSMDLAVSRGMSIVNGLHERLALRYTDLRPGQWIWDVRVEPENLSVATGKPLKLNNRRALMVGTDMSIGKMTAGLEIYREAREMNINTEFIATGQIGIVITGRGVAIDAVRVDFAAGAIEREVMRCSDADLVLVEGQGALINPSASANMALTRGTMPTHLIMCHKPGKETLRRFAWIKVPPLDQLMKLHQDLAEACGAFIRPKAAGIALNTAHLTVDQAHEAIQSFEDKTGLPCSDPVRFGARKLVESIMA
jgi:uncharacterized NAD-dependent epimerase/dehydratase family protein